jgi:hypothetical protein
VYDYYLRQNAGFYYAKLASEPLHVQLSLDDHMVSLVNLPHQSIQNLTVHAEVYDENMQMIDTHDRQVSAKPASSMEVFRLNIPFRDSSDVKFVKLRVVDPLNELMSENFYWLSPANNFQFVNDLNQVDLLVDTDITENFDEYLATVTIENPSQSLAFFIHPRLTNSGQSEVLPTFWSDNYFSLLPGESKTIQATVNKKNVISGRPGLHITGWNIIEKTINF